MQNTFSQSGNDSKWFLKIIFQNRYVELKTPPPPWKKNTLNLHFDYWNPSLSHFCKRVSPSCRNSRGEAEVAFYQTWREMMLWHGREFVYFQSKLDHIFPEEIHKPVAKSLLQVANLTRKSYSNVRGMFFWNSVISEAEYERNNILGKFPNISLYWSKGKVHEIKK